MEDSNYIIPTKENPVFVAHCSAFGNIEHKLYKQWLIKDSCGVTFAIKYKDAVNRLHEWIEEKKGWLRTESNCKFEIFIIDGSFDETWSTPIYKKVYSISSRKALELL